MIEPEGGVIRIDDYPFERYLDDDPLDDEHKPAMSASLASDFHDHSPARAIYNARERSAEYNPNLVFGSVAHSVILQQEGWADNIKVLESDYDNWRSRPARAFRDAQIAKGNLPILQKDMDRIWEMREKWEQKELARLLTVSGKSEVSVFWKCITTHIWMKARWDFLPDHKFLDARYPALDYKTTASLDGWVRKNVINYDLQLRAALYHESLLALTGGHSVNFAYAVQEKEPPYSVQVHMLSLKEGHENPDHREFIRQGHERLRLIKHAWRECLLARKWPERKELVAFDLDKGMKKFLAARVPAETSAKEAVE